MNMQRSARLSLSGAVMAALFGMASVASAQTPPPPPPPPPPPAMPAQPQAPTPPPPPAMPAQTQPPMAPPPQSQGMQQQGASGQFYQGTQSSASFPMQNGNGTVTVNSGMPQHVKRYGPPPPFKTLDTSNNGRISMAEARAYPPLESDFLFASNEGKTVSRAQYERWVKTQF